MRYLLQNNRKVVYKTFFQLYDANDANEVCVR